MGQEGEMGIRSNQKMYGCLRCYVPDHETVIVPIQEFSKYITIPDLAENTVITHWILQTIVNRFLQLLQKR